MMAGMCQAEGVAQIFYLLYRRFATCWPHDGMRAPDPKDLCTFRRFADYKSAIQQIENLRYGRTSP
jgi:hypothetical protein